jgi:hypothetical protein
MVQHQQHMPTVQHTQKSLGASMARLLVQACPPSQRDQEGLNFSLYESQPKFAHKGEGNLSFVVS